VQNSTRSAVLAVTFLLCLVNMVLGQIAHSRLVFAAGAMGLCYVLTRVAYDRLAQHRGLRRKRPARPSEQGASPSGAASQAALSGAIDVGDTDALVEKMLAQGRSTLLLRPQIVGNLSEQQFRRRIGALEKAMALVPDGEVVLGRIDEALDDGRLGRREIVACRGRVIKVDRFFLDRYPVTNREYYEFVASGGYQHMPLWDPAIWPAVLDLVDQTGAPGPRFWRDGCYLPDEEDHPVVGVSWYEAGAYARWVGKRLPTDAEWVKAGSWPVVLSITSRSQRKYPWGDNMDRSRANLWGSGPEGVVAVDEFAEGVSVGGVYQLIGNVWEWTSTPFRGDGRHAGELVLPTMMKSVRGGAFDTYFDNQATCHFQSGENPLERRHNIGIRCALGVCDLALSRSAAASAVPGDHPGTSEGPSDQRPSDDEAFDEPSVLEPEEISA
jgi:iron(II)-dependent oxidoreductase